MIAGNMCYVVCEDHVFSFLVTTFAFIKSANNAHLVATYWLNTSSRVLFMVFGLGTHPSVAQHRITYLDHLECMDAQCAKVKLVKI